jgi:hypothetical protein
MSKFKTGDMVFDLRFGFMKIKTIENQRIIYTDFFNTSYLLDGRYHSPDDFAPSLLTLEEAAKLGYFPDGSRHQISGGTKTNYQLVLNKIKGQLAFVHGAYQGLLMTENLEARNLFKMLLDETKELKELLENKE